MPPTPDPLLAPLDADGSKESGELFVDLVSSYLAETADGRGPVSTDTPPRRWPRASMNRSRSRVGPSRR